MSDLNSLEEFDYVIAGGGAAGLSLAYRFTLEKFSEYKIALVDPEVKSGTDHTWCSWLKGDNIFDNCAKNNFKRIKVAGKAFDKEFDISPYHYRMIESSRFYDFVNSAIENSPNVKRFTSKIQQVSQRESGVDVLMDSGSQIRGQHVFKSYLDKPANLKMNNNLYVDQHFKGWFIKTTEPYFDINMCTFMDFRIDQKGETRFMYVLPTSSHQALVEVAIFSNNMLTQENYDQIIADYIKEILHIKQYVVDDTEFGIIPMTVKGFESSDSEKITLFGTAGGGIKASTGFAFERIQRQCDAIIECIEQKKDINVSVFPKRFSLYDATLLNIIINGSISGEDVFIRLFKKNPPQQLFKFLDDRTTLSEEIKIMNSTDKIRFGRSFFEVVLNS
jgi:lycopene beta-cyclase